jgi:hypothetical protein
MFYALIVFQSGYPSYLMDLADCVKTRGALVRYLRLMLGNCIELDRRSESLALKNIVYHNIYNLKSEFLGLQRVFVRMNVYLLLISTEEHVLGMLKSTWQEGMRDKMSTLCCNSRASIKTTLKTTASDPGAKDTTAFLDANQIHSTTPISESISTTYLMKTICLHAKAAQVKVSATNLSNLFCPAPASPSLAPRKSQLHSHRTYSRTSCKYRPLRLHKACSHGRPRSALRNQQQSPLLRLPLELRNRIYEFVIGGQGLTTTMRKEPTTTMKPGFSVGTIALPSASYPGRYRRTRLPAITQRVHPYALDDQHVRPRPMRYHRACGT